MTLRPLDIIPTKDCCGCEACANICPKDCISMQPDEQGFMRPQFDEEACIHCDLCRKACPILSHKPSDVEPTVIACKNRNDKVRSESSSGGVFTAIASAIIDNGGVVYGAAFNDKLEVEHERIGSIEELARLRGSKYTQSHIGNCFARAKEDLRNGLQVLFTGTPCQIGGLRTFLGKEYDELHCIEVVCHGVPSRAVFRHYLNTLEIKEGAKIISFNFRDKVESWQRYSLSARFDNGVTIQQRGAENPFQRGFIADLYTRPSCTDCHFKRFVSGADITLGDFWGSGIFGTEYNDDRGISLVCINNDKGRKMFDSIKDELFDIRTSTLEDATRFNPCIVRSTTMHPKSSKFWATYKDSDFEVLITRLLHVPAWKIKLITLPAYAKAAIKKVIDVCIRRK